MNILLLTSHAIAEHDDLEMFTRMGVACYSIGGAYDDLPFEGKRPAIPNVVRYPDLEAATNAQRERMSRDFGDPTDRIDWAKARLAPEVIDWADTIIVHHFPERWIGDQWDAIREKRVIWRTCGQSDPRLEAAMSEYVAKGLQVVRYSPKERIAFEGWGAFAGEDAVIRFGKDPIEWSGWHGNDPVVGNITQHMKQRGDACGYDFWAEATRGLPAKPAGPGSEVMPGGIGELPYDTMREYLRSVRVYLYTGTRPASYTLGMIEALMTGTPVVYMGKEPFGCGELWDFWGSDGPFDHAPEAGEMLRFYLERPYEHAMAASQLTRERALSLYGLDAIMDQWRDFLGLTDARPWVDGL